MNESDYPEREIATTRIFDVEVSRLYDAWTNPTLLAKWWGPNGLTNTFNEFDLRPGGQWVFEMHGPNGSSYPNRCEFLEVVPDKKVSWNHLSAPPFRVITNFDKVGDRSKCTFRMLFETAADCEKLKTYVLEANEQNFDRLGLVLTGKM